VPGYIFLKFIFESARSGRFFRYSSTCTSTVALGQFSFSQKKNYQVFILKQNSELNDIFGILGQTFFKMQFETQKLAEPSTAARGMSFVMQSAILEAVTTRLVN